MKKKQKHFHGAVWYILGLFFIYCILMFAVTGGICPMRGLLGIPCPACGSTRAMLLFAKGDFIGGMRMNPSAPLLFLTLINEIRICYFRRGNKKAAAFLLFMSVTVSLAVYLIRMKLYFPYTEPYIIERKSVLFRFLQLHRGLQ
nr:DUF2752 domain-containing protein [uncultured Clostridium sp.]